MKCINILFFCFLFFNQCSLLAMFSCQTEWKQEIEENSIKKYINEKGQVLIPADVQYLIFKFCDMKTLKNISETNIMNKKVMGIFLLNNINYCVDLYFKIKDNESKFSKKFDKRNYPDDENKNQSASNVIAPEKIKITEIHNQLLQFLQLDCSPLHAFACSLIRYVDTYYFMTPYIFQGAKKIFIGNDQSNPSQEYIEAIKKNKYLTNLFIKRFTPGDTFPDLSACCSLTSVTIEHFVQERYIGQDCSEKIDYTDEEKEKLLRSLSNIPSLRYLNMPCFPFPAKKLELLQKFSNLKTLAIKSVMKPQYEKASFKKKEKGIREAFNIIDFFKNLKNLENVEVCYDNFFSTACLSYYKIHNDIPATVEWNLTKGLERKYHHFISKRIGEDVFFNQKNIHNFWPAVEFLSKEYDVIKHEDTYGKEIFQLIVLKELPSCIEDFCKLINALEQNTIIKIDAENSLECLTFLHNLTIDHKKIKGIVINTSKATHINANLLSKYQNLFLSLLIKKRKKMYKVASLFVLEDKEFPTISWLRTNDYQLLIKNKNNFTNLMNFCYQHRDFSWFDNKNWKLRHTSEDHIRHVIFESLKNDNALFWNNTDYKNHYCLISCNALIMLLFKNFKSIDKEKIIKRLEKIKITHEELQSLEIFLKYSYDQIPQVLKTTLPDLVKINHVSDWQKVQTKYLPIIQEQIEIKKPSDIIFSTKIVIRNFLFNGSSPTQKKKETPLNFEGKNETNSNVVINSKKPKIGSNHWALKLYAGMATIIICLLLYPKTRIKIFGTLKTLVNIDLFDHYTEQQAS